MSTGAILTDVCLCLWKLQEAYWWSLANCTVDILLWNRKLGRNLSTMEVKFSKVRVGVVVVVLLLLASNDVAWQRYALCWVPSDCSSIFQYDRLNLLLAKFG